MLMGNDHHGDARFADPFQQLHHFKAQFRVDVAGGLVRNDEAGAVGQSAGHSHALLFTAGKGVRIGLCLIFQMHQLQHVVDALVDLPFLPTLVTCMANATFS